MVVVSLAALLHVVLQFNDYFVRLANECCLFEKAEDLSTRVYIADTTKRGELRSRYAKFLASEYRLHKPRVIAVRDREPSRIPVKKLTRIMNKSRILRRQLRIFNNKIY